MKRMFGVLVVGLVIGILGTLAVVRRYEVREVVIEQFIGNLSIMYRIDRWTGRVWRESRMKWVELELPRGGSVAVKKLDLRPAGGALPDGWKPLPPVPVEPKAAGGPWEEFSASPSARRGVTFLD